MARPTTKADLIETATKKYEQLIQLIDTLEGKENIPFEFDDRDHNIRDVLVHLYEWHMLLIRWVTSNRNGMESPFLPEPYNWRTYPQMNIEIWEKHQNTSFPAALQLFKDSHKQVMTIIESYTSDQLFAKGQFTWTKGTTLGSYCVSATASHYDWAIKKITKHKKLMV